MLRQSQHRAVARPFAPPRASKGQRPPLNVGLCIDRSGSMAGAPLERALQAACHLVEQLQPSDQISVVAFDSQIEVLTHCQPASAPRVVQERLQALTARGGTNLHGGWVESCRQLFEEAAQGRLSRVLLLSDGGANEGQTDPRRIATEVSRWQSRGITTSTIGLGSGYNEDLMSAMARAGNGGFYHVQTPADNVSTFQVELLGMFSTFGQAVSLGIEPAPGVELLRVINGLEQTPKGRYKLADLVHGCPLDIVLELQVPPFAQETDLCRFRLAWTDIEQGRRFKRRKSLRLPVVARGQLSEFPLNPEVAQQRAIQLSARLMTEAIAGIDRQDRSGARAALQAGLDMLRETPPSDKISDCIQQLQRLLKQLDGGEVGEVRKVATYASSSVSLSSVSSHSGVRQFLALPPDQRTPEKFKELMDPHFDFPPEWT